MENPQRPLVNQRLYFCRLHLKWMEQALEAGEITRHIVEQSFSESVLFHLVMAYRVYLAEIATAYGSACDHLDDVTALQQLLAQQQLESAEASEIAELQESGWLQHLLFAYESIPTMGSQAQSSLKPEVIPVTQLQQPVIGLDQYKSLLESLEKLIENQRNRLEEW